MINSCSRSDLRSVQEETGALTLSWSCMDITCKKSGLDDTQQPSAVHVNLVWSGLQESQNKGSIGMFAILKRS